jgi:hypothetical protein
MTLSDPLLLAIVFLAGAVSLGLLAFALWYFRKDETAKTPEEEETPEEIAAAAGDSAKEAAMAIQEPLEASPEPEEEPEPPEGELHPVATLLREEKTGALIVRLGGKDHHGLAGLKGSPSWVPLKDATTELLRWFSEAGEKDLGPTAEAEEAPPPPPPAPDSMIDQINKLLKEKAASSEPELQSVCLIEGIAGDVRVLVGLNSYAIEEVPDDKIRGLIQDAVKEWEARH